jgi:hypothetical protein
MTEGLDVLVQLVMAANTTLPWDVRRFRSHVNGSLCSQRLRGDSKPRSLTGALRAFQKRRFRVFKRNPVLGPFWARQGRNHRVKIQLQHVAENRFGGLSVRNSPWALQ